MTVSVWLTFTSMPSRASGALQSANGRVKATGSRVCSTAQTSGSPCRLTWVCSKYSPAVPASRTRSPGFTAASGAYTNRPSEVAGLSSRSAAGSIRKKPSRSG